MYRHYIMLDEENRITGGWSTGAKSGVGPGAGDILLTDQGGYEFALLGLENPPLKTEDGIPLYRWDNEAGVIRRTEVEIKADRPEPLEPEPTEMEQIRADVDFILAMEGLL